MKLDDFEEKYREAVESAEIAGSVKRYMKDYVISKLREFGEKINSVQGSNCVDGTDRIYIPAEALWATIDKELGELQ